LLKLLRIGGAESRRIGRLPAVEGFAELAHPARDRHIANAHLPQVVVEVAAEDVEQSLPNGRARTGPGSRRWVGAEPAQHQHEVQHDQLETALDAVRNPVMGVESWRTGLCHDGAIETVDIAIGVTTPKCT